MKWVVKCLRNYANLKGRAARSEFWWFVFFGVIAGFIGIWLDFLFNCGVTVSLFPANDLHVRNELYIGGWVSWAFSLALFLPGLAVSVRRLHDTSRSATLLVAYWGGYLFFAGMMCLLLLNIETVVERFSSPYGISGWVIGLACFYGMMFRMMAFMVAYLVWLCLPGYEGRNRYGADPLAVGRKGERMSAFR